MAQAQMSKANRRREMECAVCLNRLRQPKMLMCSHNYCRDCLETLTQNQKISCPLCRVETSLGAGGVDDLAKNISLMNIIDTVCVNCYNDREVLCEYCGKWMCSQCRESCKNKHKFTQDSTNLRKELAQARKELTDTRSKLAQNVESAIDEIETRVRDIVNNAKLKGEHLKNEVRQEQNRQLDALDKLKGDLAELDKTILRTTDEDSLKGKDMPKEAFENYTRQWSDTLTKCTEEISQAYRLIEFIAGKELPSVGKVSLKPDYKSAKIETFGSKGSAPGQFDCPKRVAFSPVTKNMIVLDNSNNRVQAFNKRQEFLLEFGSKGDGEGQFNIDESFSGLAVTDDGLIVVADTDNHRLQVFTERGIYVRSIGSNGSGPGEFCWCQGLAIHNDLIYVCDQGNYRVQVFEVGGKFVRQFGSRDVFTHGFHDPMDVTVCPNKDVIVAADHSKHPDDGKLVVFTADGKHKTTISNVTGDSNSVKLHRPYGVTTNNAGHVIVSDFHTHNIHIMTDCGRLLRTVGSPGQGQGPRKLWHPIGLVCTEEGDIVVADCWNHRIQLISFK